ncbi:hypothetical protein PAHAL_3G387600 [Panicum hallii]|uniref:Uncharacterized protein n=1 Tax=Panicum hallii TaxID=206008 RepID=A0A2T8KKN6_9POAL|nr:hypothetical protein PAHAL_3G387600 [Panicum hallii]
MARRLLARGRPSVAPRPRPVRPGGARGWSGQAARAAGPARPLLAHGWSGATPACPRPALRPSSSPTAG